MIRPRTGLARHLAGLYALLVIYASLHPFSGWSDNGAPLFEFLAAPPPRYLTGLDVLLNLLAYAPFGLLLVAALRPRVKAGNAVLLALAGVACLSLLMETLQNFLPSRVPSNIDFAINCAGGLAGALAGLRLHGWFAERGGMTRWRLRRLLPGRLGDAGLALMATWLLTQLNPEILLFGNGDLSAAFGAPHFAVFTAQRHFVLEQTVAASGTLAAGLVFWLVMRRHSVWLLGALFAAALLVKTLAAATLMEPHELGQWLTAGNASGFAAGIVLLAIALRLPHGAQVGVAALALLLGVAVVNLAPENPYLADTLARWRQGHFLNFNGLTRLASMLWPFLALALLIALPREYPPRQNGMLSRP
jgi:VanZ family protein